MHFNNLKLSLRVAYPWFRSFRQALSLLVVLCCAFSLSASTSTPPPVYSTTSLANGGTHAVLCVGESETFRSGVVGCPGCFNSSTHEWIISRSVYTNNGYSNYVTHQTFINPNNSNLSYTFNQPGRYDIKVIVRDPNNFNNIEAHPCNPSGSGTCTRATVWVYGPVTPTFTVDNLSCTYDPVTGIYTNQVAILPAVDQSGANANLNGTLLDVDWGDGNSNQQHVFWNTNYTPFTHTYTWSTPNPPSVQISVTADGDCSDRSYSLFHQPVYEYYDIVATVMESNCEQQVVCFDNIPNVEDLQFFDPNGDPIPFSNCQTFTMAGTYTLLIPTGNGCPQVYQYTVALAGAPGVLYSPDSSVTPGQPMQLKLNNYVGAYIAYEILVDNCNGAPIWILFEYGPASTYDDYMVPWWVTQQFLPCMLNQDFEFCFRARVLCEPFNQDTYQQNSTISNVICMPVCAGGGEPGGGGTDDGEWLQDQETDLSLAKPTQKTEPATPKGELEVYPNPSTGQFFLELDATEQNEEINIQIVNVLGQIVWEEKLTTQGGERLEIDLSQEAPGSYFVRTLRDNTMMQMTPILLLNH